MMMDNGPTHGVPWLDMPVKLHSSRAYKCSFKSPRLCEYQQGYWRFWYQADHRYALPTIAFFTSVVVFFAILSFISWNIHPKKTASSFSRRVQATKRYLSYRTLRISWLNWNSAPVGVLLLGAIGTIYFFSMTLGPRPYYWPNTATVSFGGSPPLATRAGWMSLACLPFVLATASKSNMITAVTGTSHERLQVFHRWISYAMYTLALIHTFPFIVYHIHKGDMVTQWKTQVTYWTGVVALLAQTWSTFASFGPLRNIRYEWFKFTHFLAGLTFVVFFFLHCDFRLTSWDYFIVSGVIYSLTWLHSFLRTYFTHGTNLRATLTLLPNNNLRISIPVRTTWRASQHFFLRFPTLGLTQLWSSHPFTACSLPPRAAFFDAQKAELVFYVRARNGVTAKLARRALSQPGESLPVLLDGPYGGVDMRKLVESQRLVVIVGGSGAGFALPLIESFLRRLDLNVEDSASMRVVLATRQIATESWFEEAIGELLRKYNFESSARLSVEVHYTGSEPATEISSTLGMGMAVVGKEDVEKAAVVVSNDLADSDSEHSKAAAAVAAPITSREFGSRPDLPTIVREESIANMSTSVLVCGPLSMQHDVANAVASEQVKGMRDGTRNIYLHTEHFSWA